MKFFIAGIICLVLVALPFTAFSQQVVNETPITEKAVIMMNSLTCGFCQMFLSNAMPQWSTFQNYIEYNYDFTVPNLHILDMPPEREYPRWWIDKINEGAVPKVMATPTFFLWDGEKVIDKLVGYDRNMIFAYLHDMIKKHK